MATLTTKPDYPVYQPHWHIKRLEADRAAHIAHAQALATFNDARLVDEALEHLKLAEAADAEARDLLAQIEEAEANGTLERDARGLPHCLVDPDAVDED